MFGQDKTRLPTYDEIVDEQDDEVLERTDKFEASYNFRSQEKYVDPSIGCMFVRSVSLSSNLSSCPP